MARYKRKPTGYFRQRYQYLINSGFEDFEAQEFTYGSHYTSFKRNPSLGSYDPAIYLQRMIRWRRLYVGNLQRRGYTPNEIHLAILRLYETKGWMSAPAGFVGVGIRRDPFKMLRDFRKAAIASGDYHRPPKKGSHHKKGISREDLSGQRARRKAKRMDTEPTSGSTMFGRL